MLIVGFGMMVCYRHTDKAHHTKGRRNSMDRALPTERLSQSADVETMLRNPALPRKTLPPLRATSQFLPGAIMTPVPTPALAGMPVFSFTEPAASACMLLCGLLPAAGV